MVQSFILSKLEGDNVELDVSIIEQNVPNSGCKSISFGLQYNPTDGKLLDLFESLRQDLTTDISRFWLILSGLDIMPDFFKDQFVQNATEVNESALTNPVLQGFVDGYNFFLADGEKKLISKKLISVSHSQGNLFSNLIYVNLNSSVKSNFKIVSVANPDSIVADGGPYTTLETDLVIFAVRLFKAQLLLPEPLDANTMNATFGELSGHKFLKTYLVSGTNSQNQIIDHITGLIDIRDIVSQDCGPGAFFDFETFTCKCTDPNEAWFPDIGCVLD